MKKVISIILNILSIASAVLLLGVGVFCVYDMIVFASSPFAGSIDFWMAMRIYVTFLFAFSISGMVTGGINFLFFSESRSKVFKIFLFVLFVIGFVAAIVLFYLSHNF